MKKIATAFLVAACATTAAAGPLDGPLPRALCAGWEGETTCALLHEDAQIRVVRCAFAPGQGHEPHFHPPHFGVVLDGAGQMRNTRSDGVSEPKLKAGDTWSSDVEVRHTALNIGDQTLSYLIVEKKYADTRPAAQVAPGLCEAPR